MDPIPTAVKVRIPFEIEILTGDVFATLINPPMEVTIPDTLTDCAVNCVDEVIPNVEIPEEFKFVTEAIPPTTSVDTPAVSAYDVIPALVA